VHSLVFIIPMVCGSAVWENERRKGAKGLLGLSNIKSSQGVYVYVVGLLIVAQAPYGA
jgi:hypothetical protein